jgi:hypothetical protein
MGLPEDRGLMSHGVGVRWVFRAAISNVKQCQRICHCSSEWRCLFLLSPPSISCGEGERENRTMLYYGWRHLLSRSVS